jgi:hypothetical protein
MYMALSTINDQALRNSSRANLRKYKLAEAVLSSVSRNNSPHYIVDSFCGIANSAVCLSDNIASSCGYFDFASQSASRIYIRNYCAMTLYFAWCNNNVILPANFKMKKAITPEMRRNSPSTVLRYLSSYEPKADEERKFGVHIKQWLAQYSLSWIYCTNWLDFSNIDVDEAAKLHVFVSGHNINKKGNPSSVERVFQIFSGRGCINSKIDEFESSKNKMLDSISGHSVAEVKANAFSAPRRRNAGGFFYIHDQLKVDGCAPSTEVISSWENIFDLYITYREETDRNHNKSVKKSFRVLADYIAIMLPVSAMDASVPSKIPRSPFEFTRYPYVDQALRPAGFPTYLNYLIARGLSPASRKANLYAVRGFFKWIEHNSLSNELSDIAGSDFRCPILEADLPRVSRPSGTTKVPFRKEVYPLIISYIHEVENIGMYLERNPDVSNNVCVFGSQAGHHIINLRKLNVEFSFTFQGDTFVIYELPQLLVVGGNVARGGINLGALRLLMFLLETGLRGQSCQWLDNTSWAKHLDKFDYADPIKIIHINSDKTGKTKDIRVLSRVVEMLKRQKAHRSSKGIPEVMVDYEHEPTSPFGPMVPLFVKENGSVFSDNMYAKVWNDILLSFQGCVRENGFDIKPVIKVKPPIEFDEGETRADGTSSCRLNWSAVLCIRLTPHGQAL